jgi:formate C-acetyltransferase
VIEEAAMLGDRTAKLREMALDVSHARHRVRRTLSILPGPRQHDGQPVVIRKARAFDLILRESPIVIQDGELIVGARTMFLPQADEGGHWDQGTRRNLDFVPDAETLDVKSPGFEFYPHYATEEEKALGRPFEIGEGYVTSHCVAGYANVLRQGFGGIADAARKRLREPGLAREQRAFLDAVVICMSAATAFARRYAAEAGRMASIEPDRQRRSELEDIAAVCDRIAAAPAATFHEALQLLHFTHVLTLIESYNLMALGRMDQYLYPYFRKDVLEGKLPPARARELLECLFIKLNDTSDLHTDNGLNIVVSGLAPDGRDATNELTYLLLEVHCDVGLSDPQINVRFHAGSPDALHEKAFLNQWSGPRPMAYNDDVVVPAMEAVGVSREDARDYCIDACQDLLIGERSDFYPIFAGIYGCHLMVIFERVVDRLESFTTFEEFWKAFLREVRLDVGRWAERANAADAIVPRISPTPFLSSTLEGCVESGKDKTEGGTKYNFTGFIGGGLVNVANSAAALRKLVFEERRAGAKEVLDALRKDFADAEPLRQMLRNDAPKWGNNEPYVDDLGKELADTFCGEVLKHSNPRGGRFVPGIFTHHQARLGAKLRSTPDGRKRGEPLAVSLSPANGTAKKGPTAAVLSARKVDQTRCPLGTSLDFALPPAMFASAEERGKFEALLKTYFKVGGIELQVNNIDAAILREAQKFPERHRDLVVRVWGFNAYFISLKREYQDDLIARLSNA